MKSAVAGMNYLHTGSLLKDDPELDIHLLTNTNLCDPVRLDKGRPQCPAEP
jgi:hypothetical protein